MKNYLDEIYTVSEFKRDNPALAEQAERAMQYLKGHCLNSKETTFVVIVVEGYKCVAYLTDEFTPYPEQLAKVVSDGKPEVLTGFPKPCI